MFKRFFILSFICCLCGLSAIAQSASIEEGVGIAGVTVGKSLMSDVVVTYGKDYKLIQHEKYNYEARYANGLSFRYCYNDNSKKIYSIEIKPPYYGITNKGIVVGESTLKDVFGIYGEAEPITTTAKEIWFYEYKGIEFHTKFDSWEEVKNLESFSQKKVTAIEVVQPDLKGNACK